MSPPSPSGLRRTEATILALLVWLTICATGQTADAPDQEPRPSGEPTASLAQPFRGAGLCQFWTEDYTLTPKTEGAVNRVVEEALRKHETVFGFKARPDFRVRIRIFGRFADFERYTRTNQFAQLLVQSSQNLSNLGGYYSHGLRHIVTWPQRHSTDLGNTLLHEASHAILHSAFRRIPIWLSEGSATYFAYPRHVQDDRDIGSLQYRWGKLMVMLRGGQLPPLRTVLNWTEKDWGGQDPAVTYTTAWSLFQLMMSTPERQELMRQYLRSLQSARRRGNQEARDEARPSDPADALESQWPGGLKQLEKEWHDWIRKGAARVLGSNLEEVIQQVR